MTSMTKKMPKNSGSHSQYNRFHHIPSNMLDGGRSLLLRHVSYRIFDTDICSACDMAFSSYRPHQMCTCNGNKRLMYNHIIVSVPFSAKPHEAVYTVSVYAVGEMTTQSSLASDILNLDEKEKIAEFSVMHSVDDYSTPMYQDTVDLVKQYGIHLWHYACGDESDSSYDNPTTPWHNDQGGLGVQMCSKFVGCSVAEVYVSFFRELIGNIAKTTAKVVVSSDPVGRGRRKQARRCGIKVGTVGSDGVVNVTGTGMLKSNPHVGPVARSCIKGNSRNSYV